MERGLLSEGQYYRSWYEEVTQPIRIDEITKTINQSPNGKTLGPELTSNEMLKKLRTIALEMLEQIFNSCLLLNQVPKM